MTALAERVILAWGWQRALIAFVAGAAGALALPPFGLLPMLAVSLAPAVWLIDGAATGGARPRLATLRSAAVAGWWWGFGYFLAGLWWLGSAFLVEADQFAWALPLGVLGLPMGLAVFPALGFALARVLWSKGAARIFALAFGLGSAEWLRGNVLSGFPWNTLGMALGSHLWLMQAAAVVGLYGLTVLAVLVGAAPAALAAEGRRADRLRAPVLAALALALVAGLGAVRVPADPVPAVAGVRLRLLQPNLPQDAKFSAANREEIMRRYLTLSDRATSPRASGVADVTHLVWPESAFPFLLHRDARALAQIAALLPPGVTLLTGAARAEEPLPGEEGWRYYNAIHAVGDDGTILATYDKAHLVPFGEYLPPVLDRAMRAVGIRQFVHVPGGFAPAEGRRVLQVRGLPPVAATICYEAIFPGAVVPEGPEPGLILNVTNDAWFGDTPGPRQHLAQARLRAVEEGLPLVRDANTGISAVVDPYGRIVAQLPLGQEGVLDSDLPKAIAAPPYRRYGDVLFLAMLVCCAVSASITRRARRSPSPQPAG